MRSQILALEADQLGDAEPGRKSDVEHGTIARPHSGGGIWSIEQGLDLSAREVVDQRLRRLLRGDRQNGSDLLLTGCLSVFEEVREGFDGGKSGIAGGSSVSAVPLEVLEKGDHQRSIDLLEYEG